MKKIQSVIIIAILLTVALTTVASAETFVWNDGYRTITQIYPDTDFQFYLDGDTIDTNSSCTNRFVIRNADSNYATKVASLLTAFQNGGTVLVKFDEDDTSCGTDIEMFKVLLE